MEAQFPEVFALSPQDKLRLVEALWDSLAQSPQAIPLPDWQLAELQRRKEAHLANPQAGMTWEEVKRQITGDHG